MRNATNNVIAEELSADWAMYAVLRDWEHNVEAHGGHVSLLSLGAYVHDAMQALDILRNEKQVTLIVATTMVDATAYNLALQRKRFDEWHVSQAPTLYHIYLDNHTGVFVVERIMGKF